MTQQITDNLEVTGSLTVDNNLVVRGTITTDTFNVKNLVTENGSTASFGRWVYGDEEQLAGKGFTWSAGAETTQLIYRQGNRLWTNAEIFDLAGGSAYGIDNIKVLTLDSLGGTVTKSHLTRVGTLQSLNVSGDVSIAEFLFVNSDSNRVGIGTDEPDAALTVLENNVQINIGSPEISMGAIGTKSHHDLVITTDGLARITVKASGAVNIGDPLRGGGVLNVYGTIHATSVITEHNIERHSPINFKVPVGETAYGLGFNWVDNTTRQFILMANPDRLWSTESIDLGPNQAYYLNGMVAISSSGLGDTIVNSKLQTLGTLDALTVSGDTQLHGTYTDFVTARLAGSENTLQVSPFGLSASGNFKLSVHGLDLVTITQQEITIGNPLKTEQPVKVFGKLSVNVNNPDPTLHFDVAGDVRIGGKRFTSGVTAPVSGAFVLGDICWNVEPTPSGYVGWICTATGTPGVWAPFGMIASQ
jgi:hypothetical protein